MGDCSVISWSVLPVASPRRSNVMTLWPAGEIIVQPVHSDADTVCDTLLPDSLMTHVAPLHGAEPFAMPTYQGEDGLTVKDTVFKLETPTDECLIASERAICARFEIARI